MLRTLAIFAALAVVVALPFVFRRAADAGGWSPGDPVLVVISPHNEAIRREFGRAFSAWHKQRYGRPVNVDWRTIGGTTEIMRYLEGEYVTSFRAWWRTQDRTWPDGGGAVVLDRKFDPSRPPAGADRDPEALRLWEAKCAIHRAFRQTDNATAFGAGIDLLFGGGAYDHGRASAAGLTVPPWPEDRPPDGVLRTPDGGEAFPAALGGEVWRTANFFGTALSTFGICYNHDRLRDLGVTRPPSRWSDLTDPVWFGQIGLADPTKSGSIAKAFEMIIHEQCQQAVERWGFGRDRVDDFEARIARARLPPGRVPPEVPAEYQEAVEQGWAAGIRLVQRIAANARYFTDSASKVPIDVSLGSAAAGVAIDFYGRFQAEVSRLPDGRYPMEYVTPTGGSSVSADPISLLRGAPHRELALRFIRFVLDEDGQRLWNYTAGSPGGPVRYALRRLPIRRDFYPGRAPGAPSGFDRHRPFLSDNLADPDINPYALGDRFVYRPRWTGSHFGVHRILIRAMCMDAGAELRTAWRVILERGGPDAQPAATALLSRLPSWPQPMTWVSAPDAVRDHDALECQREWTLFFRRSYREARQAAERNSQDARPAAGRDAA